MRTTIPHATYRLQLHKGFTIGDATALVPYLSELGISDAYTAPILKARSGSAHGYDIIDHAQVNPEIGGEAELRAWAKALQSRGMGILLDIVPNHMAVVGNENSWWNDVLENGPSSPFADYFDIAWSSATRAQLQGRVLIPVLGEPYVKVLEGQQLRLMVEGGTFTIAYADHRFPVAPRSYEMILEHGLEKLKSDMAADDPALIEYQSILTAVKHLPRRNETDPALVVESQREKEVIKRRLAATLKENTTLRLSVEQTVERFNGVAGDSASFDLMERLLEDQTYRLAFWRVAAEEINYRRFFDVNELAALSMERADVFAATHEHTLGLARDGIIRGLRIDHVDGLFDPKEYLNRLQAAVQIADPDSRDSEGRSIYLIVEKILGADETLPESWPTQGTTGYDFLNQLNGLFVDSSQAAAFSRVYADWIGDETTFAETAYQKKILVLQIVLAGEMQMLTKQLDHLAQLHRTSRDFTWNSLRIALREIIACFPVYRSYINGEEPSDADRRHVLKAVRRAAQRNPSFNTSIFHFIRDTLLMRSPGPGPQAADYTAEQRRFVGKFQQVTSAVMAKAAEDTAGYIFNRLISLNEVGGDPDRFGLSVAEFHAAMRVRQTSNPGALSATATHDTKRGEDVRARINVLSEMPEDWRDHLARWSRLNDQHRGTIEDLRVPDRNEEYFIYQTLLGAWPDAARELDGFTLRMRNYVFKALHEAKVHTSWINPNQPYDDAVAEFVQRILDPAISGPFLQDFAACHSRIREFGMINSLGQVLIKVTAPGVPDFYQGTELWDLNFVDPDNRRPVDFALRQEILRNKGPSIRELIDARLDGRIKFMVAQRSLAIRREFHDLFARGDYVPLTATGPLSDHVVSFARVLDNQVAIVVAARLLARATPADESPWAAKIWEETTIAIDNLPSRWRNALTNEVVDGQDRTLYLDQVLATLPVGLLVDESFIAPQFQAPPI